MASEFSRTLSLLRQERGVSQRTAAGDLGISQALLSHYENGIREPGLLFVVKACDYYHVSADFILGRTLSREGSMLTSEEILNAAEPGNVLQGSILATLQSKLLSGAIGVVFGLLGKLGEKTVINAASEYLSSAVYQLYRHLYRSAGANEAYFSLDPAACTMGLAGADMKLPGPCGARRPRRRSFRTSAARPSPTPIPAAARASPRFSAPPTPGSAPCLRQSHELSVTGVSGVSGGGGARLPSPHPPGRLRPGRHGLADAVQPVFLLSWL